MEEFVDNFKFDENGRTFYSSKLKEFADDNFKFDENGRKLSKREKNTVGKGVIAPYK